MTWPRICVVGPLPPPSGGMGNQCAQLVHLLCADGLRVELVQTNPPYRPAWSGQVPVLRAGLRLLPYLRQLWQATARADVVHVLANSGWAWHVFAAPAIAVARLQRVGVIVHYHGGQADAFFTQAPGWVRRMLAGASLRVIPSPFLQRVFARLGLVSEVIPNSVDLSLFAPQAAALPVNVPPADGRPSNAPVHLVVTRNLEAIYDIPTALRTFAQVRQQVPSARLTVAGSGPELERLQALAQQLQVAPAVVFTGRLANADMAALLRSATCLLNPSRVDNMPVSVLEAFACGVPVVSTRAGGIPDMLQDGVTGLLADVGDDAALAAQVLRVLGDAGLAASLREAGLAEAQKYSWPRVKALWLRAYCRAAAGACTARARA